MFFRAISLFFLYSSSSLVRSPSPDDDDDLLGLLFAQRRRPQENGFIPQLGSTTEHTLGNSEGFG